MGIKKKTIKFLFCQFAVSLIGMLALAVIVPFVLEILAVNAGLATKANQSELKVKEIIPILMSAPDIETVVIPQDCDYLILDKNFNELSSNMSSEEKEAALLYAKGEYMEYGTDRKYELVVRENEICILQYYVVSKFTISWLPKHFPSPDTVAFILMIVNCLLVIIILTTKFAKNIGLQLTLLFEATEQIGKQNLDFQIGHSKIKELEEVLLAFSDMKENLKVSLEQQWKTEQMQKEQIAALAHDLKTPLTVIQGNMDLINETELDEEQQVYANYVMESSQQMQVYIKTLIDISKAAVGYELHKEKFDFCEWIQNVERQMKAICLTKAVQFQMDVLSAPEHLEIDSMLMERAIMNVINNAVDYSKAGGRIWMEVCHREKKLQIIIRDEGVGFSKEALLHARERFFMGDVSRGSKMHYGMGLYITDLIMKQHDGKMILKNSKKSSGAEVVLEFTYSL